MKSFVSSLYKNSGFLLWIVFLAVGSYYWCKFFGSSDPAKIRLIGALTGASFALGNIFGFLFSSYGEEQTTIGKVRDWLIGGITGLGLAEAIEQGGTLKRILQKFQSAQSDNDFALVIGTAIVWTALGFFFMFFERELLLNVSLAAKRAERGRIDGTHQAGLVIQRTLSVLPASLLSGVEDVDTVATLPTEEAKHLKESLYSPEVEAFLSQASDASREGAALDWDVVSKVAYIHYYRSYFEPQEKKPTQVTQATDWVVRALIMNPLHADLTMKYADLLLVDKQYEEAAAVLDRLTTWQDCPLLVWQWLGYVLLYIPSRIKEGITWSQKFHDQFPGDANSLFNVACGYAQLHSMEMKAGHHADRDSENRRAALETLRRALELDPAYITTIATKWIEKGQDFECMKSDRSFLGLIEEFKKRIANEPITGDQASKSD